MNNPYPLPDADWRLTAETTFDRNVVVLAGAGTGKTTLLVNRLIHALLKEPDPLRLTEMLALTFTNKAANEMKNRLRDRLQGLLGDCDALTNVNSSGNRLEDYRQRYHVSTEQMREKIQVALNDLEKAQIATLHSFAAHILRLYPLESLVDPNFREDEGTQFLEIFQEAWNVWLDQELGTRGSAHEQWREVFTHVGLKEIRAFAFCLCQDQISLSELVTQVGIKPMPPAFLTWLQSKQEQVQTLLKRYGRESPRKIEKLLALAGQVFEKAGQQKRHNDFMLSEPDTALFDSAIGKAPAEWDALDFQDAKRAIQSAHRLLQVDETVVEKVIHLLVPFAARVRQMYSDKGLIRFDGLLIRVRNLLRDHPMVREQLKRTYRAIMVDEFQDTDPVQYEILLYLGERAGEHGRLWRDLHLIPGKLFIVGDPKQSIYAFRRADIEAFDQVVNKLTQEGGVVCTLLANFRSDGAILEVVNAVFDRLFIPQANVQPPNVPLAVGRRREAGFCTTGVELCVMANVEEEEEWDADRATRLEAEWLAGWIEEQLQPGKQTTIENGMRSPLRPGHIAVLLRKFTNAQVYLEALQRHAIPCVTDGERHFYRRQEVIDVVNVLRVLDDPTDGIALVGILRSSLGGLTDQEIMEITNIMPFDLRKSHLLKEWESPRKLVIQHLFQRLAFLQSQANRVPISDLLDQLFFQLPIVELAAASNHGEQAVANVWKLRDLMNEQAAVPHLSFSAWMDRLAEFLMTHPSEPEAPLAEETLEAVRVLTIHKAKGLEFPVVVLPGLHQKAAGTDGGADISFDWISGLYGCTIPPVWNAGQVPIWEKQRIREEAEQRRVLYVGMTRARERLVLSGGVLPKRGGASLLGLLQQIGNGEFGNPEKTFIKIGEIPIPQTVFTPAMLKPMKTSRPSSESTGHMKKEMSSSRWSERETRWQQTSKAAAYLTPSMLHPEPPFQKWEERQQISRRDGQRVGTLMHRLLQRWDFQGDHERWRDYLAVFCQQHLSCELEKGEIPTISELETLLDRFLLSPAYRELQRATVLGREVPFAIPWTIGRNGHSMPQTCVMEGIMDVVYEIDGEIWVGDYKTDQVSASAVRQRVQMYREQARAYAVAASRSLGLNVKGCKLFFIRPGEVVQVALHIQTNGFYEEQHLTRRDV